MSLSFDRIRELVRAVLGGGGRKWIQELYPDAVVYSDDSVPTKTYRQAYVIVDGKAQLVGDSVEVSVKTEWIPVKSAILVASESAPVGERWRVQVLKYGTDKNGNHYERKVMAAHLHLFEGAKVFCLEEAQHQDPKKKHPMGKSVREIVGWLENVTAADSGVEGDLVFASTGSWLAEMVGDAWAKGKKDLVGLSVDMRAAIEKKTLGGRKIVVPHQILSVEVDVVYRPAADGKFLRLVAAEAAPEEEDAMFQKLMKKLQAKKPGEHARIQAAIDASTLTEADAVDQILAALDVDSPAVEPPKPAAPAGEQSALEKMQLLSCGMQLEATLTASGLPEPVVHKMRKVYSGKVFEVADLQAAVQLEKETLDKLTASGAVKGSGASIIVAADDFDRRKSMLDDLFAGKVHSIQSAYRQITGDDDLTGRTSEARILSSLNVASWGEILGDAITRKLLADYAGYNLDECCKFAEIVPLKDFRTQHRVRFGGYGDLPTVAEGAAYQALASPADEEATYAASKKGGTEDFTWEMLLADDVQALRRIPTKLARAAKRTYCKFVLSFLTGNGAIYDAKALFHADHANLLTAALAKASLQAARRQMLKQVEPGSSEPLGIPPRFILVPVDLEDTAFELTVKANEGNFQPTQGDAVRRFTWEVLTNPFATDVNDWFLIADPKDIPTIEVGFVGGNQEPELFIQDNPTVGSLFTNDKITYKLRHGYGGAVVEYRGFQGNIVA